MTFFNSPLAKSSKLSGSEVNLRGVGILSAPDFVVGVKSFGEGRMHGDTCWARGK